MERRKKRQTPPAFPREPVVCAPPPREGPGVPLEKRKKRLTPVFADLSTPGLVTKPQVCVRPTLSLGGGVEATLNLPRARVESVNCPAQLERLLRRLGERGAETEDLWCRCPKSRWIRSLWADLEAPAREALVEELRAVERDDSLEAMDGDEAFLTRWSANEAVASGVLDRWFEGRGLDEVLARSCDFGHDRLPSGVVLAGKWAEAVAAGRDLGVQEVADMVRKLSPESTGLFRVRKDNAFYCETTTVVPTDQVPGKLRDARGGCGSLDTTWDYEKGCQSGVPLLDDYFDALSEVLFRFDDNDDLVRLNPKAYLIFKQPRYCTPYHQDVHVPPHFTLYNQVSGYSAFHFLPLLVGLYATHVGAKFGPAALAQLQRDLEGRGVGEVATVGPHQVVLILPFGAHGVFVPEARANPALPRFDLSLIRAAEAYLWPTYNARKRLFRDSRDAQRGRSRATRDAADEKQRDAAAGKRRDNNAPRAARAKQAAPPKAQPVDECIEFMHLAVEAAAERKEKRRKDKQQATRRSKRLADLAAAANLKDRPPPRRSSRHAAVAPPPPPPPPPRAKRGSR